MFSLNAHRKAAAPPTARAAAAAAQRGARRGFTLVEILTVVLILGIASAIIAPQIGTRNDLKARAAARVLIADLLYAQNMAVAQQRPFYVKFDDAAEQYRILSAAGPSGADVTVKNPITKDPFVMTLGPSGNARLSDVRIKSAVFNGVDPAYRPEYTLAFDELGTPYVFSYDDNAMSELLDGTVVLECGVHEITITVERYTGEIKVN